MRYAKLIKKFLSNKCLVNGETIEVLLGCSTIMTSAMAENEEYPGSFTISYTIGTYKYDNALCDLSASINLVPYEIYRRLGLVSCTPTKIRLFIANWFIKRPVEVYLMFW